MYQIKRIPLKEMNDFCRISANAYSAMGCHIESEMNRLITKLTADERLKNISTWGAYQDRELLGGLRLFDFWGTLFETRVLYGGGGFLAVDLMNKKQKVARELMLHFIRHYREMDSPIAILYPFRPDFYRKMGFGYGTKINEYRVKPADLPSQGGKDKVEWLSVKDIDRIVECHNRVAARTHGMLDRSGHEFARLKNPANRLVGYVSDGHLEGFMVVGFKQLESENFLLNDMIVTELVYEHPAALAQFCCFLNSQSDQINRIRFVTSDPTLHFLPVDPRDDTDKFVGPIAQQSNRQGVALMYRVISMPALISQLSQHSFGGVDLMIELNLTDSFLPENEGSYLIEFRKGKPRFRKSGRPSVRVGMRVEDFSSLLMGTIEFESLYDYGLAEISDIRKIGLIGKLFHVPKPPLCYTQF